MTLHRHVAGVQGRFWLTVALLKVTGFMTRLPAVGASSNISTISVPTSFSNSSVSLLSFGNVEEASPTYWLGSDGNDDIFIDPNCDPKLVIRQIAEDDENPNCPCCYSRDGAHLPPYQTPFRLSRTAVAPTSWTVEHSLWQATATIRGEPVPTDDPEDELEFEACVNCADGRCMLPNSKRRRQIDDEDEDTSPWPSSDDDDEDELDFSEEEDQDPSTATDILTPGLTHPAVWQYGEDSWWRHMYDLVTNRGARFGPAVPPSKTDPVLRLTGSYMSHASMIHFDKTDDKGKLVRVEEGLAGGIIPIYGCTGIIIATDRGVYAAHIWEAPTFMTVPGRPREEESVRRLHWDINVNQFFARGHQNIVTPPSPALADLAKEDGPLRKHSWIQVHTFAVRDPRNPDQPLYAEKMKEVEAEIQKHLGNVPDSNYFRHLYIRNPPRGTDGTTISSNEYYREYAGRSLVAWQYAPKEATPMPGEKKLQDMRAFRLWFNKRIITTKRWCDADTKDCAETCGREKAEKDPNRTTQIGGMGKPQSEASGSGSKPKDSGSGTKPGASGSGTKAGPSRSGKQIRDVGPAAPRSLVRRVPRSSPRLPPEFTQMFPDAFTDPRTWPYGSLDWWKRMYTVAVKYGATGDPSELLNIISGDDYEADHCVYRELPNLGHAGTGGGIAPLYGCSGLLVASNKGVYVGHFWERPNFMPPPDFHQQRKPELYGDERELWDRRVMGTLRNGWQPYFEDYPWGPSLEELAPTVFEGPGVDWLNIWIFHPDRSRTELTGEALYATKVGWLKDELKQILPIKDDNIELVTYMKYDTEAVSIIGSDRYYANNPGTHMLLWQFAPDAPARRPSSNFRSVNAIKVFWDRKEIWYYEWCPPQKDCSAPEQAYCSQRVAAGPSTREALAIRQEPAAAQPTDPPSNTSDVSAKPTELPYRKFFLPHLTSPSDVGTDAELWWKRMYDSVALYGARMHEVATSPDDFFADHAAFLDFEGVPEATGIAPMWGCTGIVVMSDKGVYTARIWEAPSFVVPYEAENPYTYAYDEEITWQTRVVRLLTKGIAMQDEEKNSPSLAGLANGTNAFSPKAREWLHVQIITPKAIGNATETRPLYFKKVAKLRDLLVSILGIEKEEVKIKTYSSRKDTKTQALNGTGDAFAETEERYEDRPGANLLGIQYAPAHVLHANTTKETTVRAVRMWWDREDYFTIFWCAPYAFADFPPNSNATSDIRCIRPGRKSAGENELSVCAVSYRPSLYPYDNMRAHLYVGFSRFNVTEDGKLGTFHYESSHNVSTTLGSLLTIPAADSGLPKDFSVQFGQAWDEWLWRNGYTCRCDGDEGGCDLFSPSCCRNGSCRGYACNCAEPDDGGELCWPDQRHVARCCLQKEGCLDEDMRRYMEKVIAPNMPWEEFEHGFTRWSSRRSGRSARPATPAGVPTRTLTPLGRRNSSG
ncbi:hypothetical protein VUR80DRAFT_5731 [Thermomyces stellatus]